MSFYSEMAATATEMIREFGQPMTLTQPAAGNYDTLTASVVAGSPTTHAVLGVVFDYPSRMIDGTRILQGDKQVYLATKTVNGQVLAITPRPDMKITDASGVVYTIITSKPLAPAVEAVMHELQVRA